MSRGGRSPPASCVGGTARARVCARALAPLLDFLAAALFDFAMMLSRFWAWGIVSARHMPADRPPELSLEKPPPGSGGIRSLTEGAERRNAKHHKGNSSEKVDRQRAIELDFIAREIIADFDPLLRDENKLSTTKV
jgi:hypothetical protein